MNGNDFRYNTCLMLFDHYNSINSSNKTDFPNNTVDTTRNGTKNNGFNEYVPLFPPQMNVIYNLNPEIYKAYIDEEFIQFINKTFDRRAVFLLSNLTLLFLTVIIVGVSPDEKIMIGNFFTFYEKNNYTAYANYRYFTQDIPVNKLKYIPLYKENADTLKLNKYKFKRERSNIIFHYV